MQPQGLTVSDRSATISTGEVGCSAALRWSDLLVGVTLSILAAALRAPGLNPPALWLDDVWVALAHRISDPAELFEIGVTAPGFVFALKAIFLLFGFSEAAAQALPFVAGVVGPALTYLLARRLGVDVAGAALAGLLIVVAPYHVEYSTAVKQFTSDLVAVVAVLRLAWRAVEASRAGRWAALLLGGVAATIWSASVVPAVAAGMAAAAWGPLLARQLTMLIWPGAYAAFVLGWWLLLRGSFGPSLDAFWADFTADNPIDLLVGTGRYVERFLGAHDSLTLSLLLAFVVLFLLGFGLRWAGAELRLLLWGPLVFALLASLVSVPLGTGRTDLYLYGPTAVALGMTISNVIGDVRIRSAVAGLMALAAAVPLASPAYADPDGSRNVQPQPLLEHAQELMDEDDVLVLLWAGSYAATLYSDWEFDRDPDLSTVGWHPAPRDERIHVVHSRDDTLVDDAVAAAGDGRVLLLWTRSSEHRIDAVTGRIEQGGFDAVTSRASPGAELVVYESESQATQ